MGLVITKNGNFYDDADPGEIGCTERRLSVTREEASSLADVCRDKKVLEIGTGLGISTRAIASTAFHVVTIDIDPWVATEIAPHLPPNVDFVTDRSGVWGDFDVVFIDGSHTEECTLMDLELARDSNAERIFLHDTNIEDVQKAMKKAGVRVVRRHGAPCYMAEVAFE